MNSEIDFKKIDTITNSLLEYGRTMEQALGESISIGEFCLAAGCAIGSVIRQTTDNPSEAAKAAMETLHRGVAAAMFYDQEGEENPSDAGSVQGNNEESGSDER